MLDKIGKYEISEQIGVGGFGAVYRGRDPFIKRTVAIKTCQVNDEEIKNRFFREAELAGNLHHRNITTIYDFGVENGIPVHRPGVPDRRGPRQEDQARRPDPDRPARSRS